VATYAQTAAGALRRLGSDSRFTATLQEDAVRQALKKYSDDLPRVRITAATVGTGNPYGSLPTDFIVDESEVLAVEYPTGEDDPVFLPRDETRVERVSDGSARLRFRTVSPPSSTSWAMIYTASHALNGLKTNVDDTTAQTTTTVPKSDDEALMDLSAHYGAAMLMGETSDLVDSNIEAGIVDQMTQFERFERLGARYLKQYQDKVLNADAHETVGGFVNWGEARRQLLFMHTVVLSKWEPNYDRYAPFFILR